MTKSLILASHGRFCEELKNSVEMIMGEQEMIYTIPLLADEGEADFLGKLEKIRTKAPEFVVFVDLSGGTPCNIFSKLLLNGENFDLYAGMNMPMVLSFINSQLLGNQTDYLAEAKSNMVKVNDLLLIDDEDDE